MAGGGKRKISSGDDERPEVNKEHDALEHMDMGRYDDDAVGFVYSRSGKSKYHHCHGR